VGAKTSFGLWHSADYGYIILPASLLG